MEFHIAALVEVLRIANSDTEFWNGTGPNRKFRSFFGLKSL
jgi:hypothetical protein